MCLTSDCGCQKGESPRDRLKVPTPQFSTSVSPSIGGLYLEMKELQLQFCNKLNTPFSFAACPGPLLLPLQGTKRDKEHTGDHMISGGMGTG